MRVLHICNGFVGSKVHTNLFRKLDEKGVKQTIFTCVYNRAEVGRNQFPATNTSFVYANILRQYYRPFYHLKKWITTRSLINKIDAKSYDCVHATTLFTDGAQAYELFKRFGIPYVVALRNTDVNFFLVKAPYTWSLGKKILRNASKIVFISKALMESFSRNPVIAPIVGEIEEKFLLCPNGIDDYWLQNISRVPKKGHHLLYVGDFSANKNVLRVIRAVNILGNKPEFSDIHLSLVGGGNSKNAIKRNDDGNDIDKAIEGSNGRIEFLGKIYDKEKLRRVYSACDLFVMPSIHETFGLVYVEALSQNLPVIYTRGQGIDGLFSASVGESADALSVESIVEAIQMVLSAPEKYSNESVPFSCFDWDKIADKYIAVYSSL